MAQTSTVTPANLINTARTANTKAASSTANPNFSATITTWTLPGYPSQPQVQSTQSFSTLPGQTFTDFASGQVTSPPGTTSGQQTYSLPAGTPGIDG
jgi:hypothetical protein